MEEAISSKNRLFELVSAGRLEKYLRVVSESSGLCMKILGDGGATLVSVSNGLNDGPDGGTACGRSCTDSLWEGAPGLTGHGAGEVTGPEGASVLSAPLYYRGERLATLAVCSGGDGAGYQAASSLISMISPHIESLLESGYEVESLSAEVVRVYEELSLIYGLIARLGSIVDVMEICRVVAEEARNLLDALDVIVYFADTDAGVFRTVLAIGEHRDDVMGFAPGLEEGLVGAAYVGHRSLIVCEVDKDRRHTGWPYPIRRFLGVPLMTEGKVIGMLCATDKRDGEEFNTREEKLLSAMSSVAAVSIKNAQLYTNIKGLFEGFINSLVMAVESRDPTTAGHSSRVAHMTVGLAREVDASDLPIFSGVKFTSEDLLEILYAGLLHDLGKIGVREHVLLKSSKLTEEQLENIRSRFAYIRERIKRESAEARLDTLIMHGEEAYSDSSSGIEAGLARELALLDEYSRLVEMANNPRVLLSGIPEYSRLEELADKYYTDSQGERMPYLTTSELQSLLVPKGSLSKKERSEVESHVTHSYNFLSRVPWSKGFSNIADIVHAHHEKLDGSGYPRGLKSGDIPIQSKMMAVADIYDALTAWDRPYKDAVSPQKALFILEMEAAEGRLEPHLVQIFRDARIYRSVDDMLPGRGRDTEPDNGG